MYYAKHNTLAQVFKYRSDMGHCFSQVVVVSKKSKKKRIFFLFFYFSKLGKTDIVLGKKVAICLLGMGPKFGPKGKIENPMTMDNSKFIVTNQKEESISI